MQRVHRAKWNDKESQEQRAAEQAQRDHQIEEAKKVYTTFCELPLEIVVDVRSFTITHLAEPQEIVIPDSPATVEQQPAMATPSISRRPAAKSYRDPNKVSKVSAAGKKSPVLVAPEPNTSTKLKNPSLQNTRAMNRAPVRSRKQTKPRQSGLFKRFTLLIVDFLKRDLYGPKGKTIPLTLTMISVLPKTMSLMRYWVCMFHALSLKNSLNLTMTKHHHNQGSVETYQIMTRLFVFQVALIMNSIKKKAV